MGETLEIVLMDGSKITVDKVCLIPIQFCKKTRQAVLYHVVENILSCLILSMQWLKGTNPTIRLLEHEVDLLHGQSIVALRGLKKTKLPLAVELCSAKASIKAIKRGEQALFMMLCAPGTACPHEVDSTLGNGMVVQDQSSDPTLVSKLKALLTEYADVFEQPRGPVSIPVNHYIDLVDPKAVPPKQ